ncbi:MAG: signal recognition particle receptor subunit alpha, partial [Acidimicrobiales bacterium]
MAPIVVLIVFGALLLMSVGFVAVQPRPGRRMGGRGLHDASVVSSAVTATAPDVRAAPDEAPSAEEAEESAVALERPRLSDRLAKARSFLGGRVASVLSRSAIDDDSWDELEEALIGADVGVATTSALLDELR